MINDPASILSDIKNKLEAQKANILGGDVIDFNQLHDDIEQFLKIANISGDNFDLYSEDLNHIREIITSLTANLSVESNLLRTKISQLNDNVAVNKAYMSHQNQ
jgi:hypothetical protein